MPVINPTPASGSNEGADFGPCADWPIQWVCTLDATSAAVTGVAVSAATEILWALSGRQFGLCEVTLRPCRRECDDGRFYDDYGPPWTGGSYPQQPALIGGLWYNLTCGSCPGSCSCATVSEVVLPSPVHEIVTVKVDGVVVTGGYRLDNNRLLVRTDGTEWPRCNNLALDDTEPGTWSITATYGQVVPEAGKLAMGELACQLVKAIGGGDCRLPAGVQQLVRQGVTISYPDVGELFRKGRTGLYLVDAFLAAFNPGGLRQRSRVYRVDGPTTVRRPGT